MTKLLAQSDFVAGRGASAEARTMFNTKSQGLQALAPQTGVTNEKNIAIASLGGEAKGDQAGYGKGSHAGVQGQGSGQVSLDAQGAAVEEGLTKDEVGEVIHKHLGEIRYCYESAMIRSPDVEGKLMVNFSIGGTGVVRSSEVASSSLSDPRLDDCILRRLSTWKFPEPRGHVTVAVSYPFIFKSLGR
ncbi:MAG: TonB family protein [Bdellovibrionota bacterium]